MKRSEMVQKVMDIVYMANHDDFTLTEEEASEVLSKLEEAGMLPPVVELEHFPGHYDNAWEPEEK